jgi:hypothetical protein
MPCTYVTHYVSDTIVLVTVIVPVTSIVLVTLLFLCSI